MKRQGWLELQGGDAEKQKGGWSAHLESLRLTREGAFRVVLGAIVPLLELFVHFWQIIGLLL